jgi:hypothetical protein
MRNSKQQPIAPISHQPAFSTKFYSFMGYKKKAEPKNIQVYGSFSVRIALIKTYFTGHRKTGSSLAVLEGLDRSALLRNALKTCENGFF